MRAVLDPNVLVSALISSRGAPAQLLEAWARGEFELILSPLLVAELERALAYPKLRRHIAKSAGDAAIAWIMRSAVHAHDPQVEALVHSTDPGDDYLIALAASERAALVSGDRHLLDLAATIPVHSPRAFLEVLA